MYLNNLGHMNNMAAIPIYGKNPSKTFFRTGGLISTKLGMKHQWLKNYHVYINHEWGKILQEMGNRTEYQLF